MNDGFFGINIDINSLRIDNSIIKNRKVILNNTALPLTVRK